VDYQHPVMVCVVMDQWKDIKLEEERLPQFRSESPTFRREQMKIRTRERIDGEHPAAYAHTAHGVQQCTVRPKKMGRWETDEALWAVARHRARHHSSCRPIVT